MAAAVLWIVVLFGFIVLAQRKRKTERTGRIFTLAPAEQTVQILVSFLAGLWMCSFLSDFLDPASVGIGSIIGCTVGGVVIALAVHLLLEYAVQGTEVKFFRRKWQLVLSAAAVIVAGLAFPAGASAYDTLFPENAESIGISIDGIGMDCSTYAEVSGNQEKYETAAQLRRYQLKGEGRTAVLTWLQEIIREDIGESSMADSSCTRAKVCYYMPDGGTHYRSYPLTREQVEMFASVYETDEYKRIAYPAVKLEDVSEDRFTWEDSVRGTALQITGDQKEALLDAYRQDVSELKMEQLGEELLCGYTRIRSSSDGSITNMFVYPFFELTCDLLKEYGIDTEKRLADYKVDSIEVLDSYPVSSANGPVSGGMYTLHYEKEDEVEAFSQNLIPEELDIQPLLYPLDHSAEIEALVVDEETNSILHVSCAQKRSE